MAIKVIQTASPEYLQNKPTISSKPTVGGTLLGATTQIGKGVLGFGETAFDAALQFGTSKYNPYYWFNPDKLKSHQAIAQSLIKDDSRQELLDKVGYNKVDPTTGKTYQQQLDEKSAIKSTGMGGQVLEGLGGQLPSIVLGNLGAGKAASTLGSTIPLAASAYGGGIQEAYQSGANRQQANLYGGLNTAVELATEYITGGVPGVETGFLSGIDKLASKGINKVSSAITRSLLDAGYKIVGEGFEEALAEIMNPLIKNVSYTSGEKVNWKNVINSAVQGAILGGLLNAPSSIAETSNAIQQQNAIKQQNKPATQTITPTSTITPTTQETTQGMAQTQSQGQEAQPQATNEIEKYRNDVTNRLTELKNNYPNIEINERTSTRDNKQYIEFYNPDTRQVVDIISVPLDIIKNKTQEILQPQGQAMSTQPIVEEVPKTVKVFVKSKFSDNSAYTDVPVIRKEDGITLYQGTNEGENRQFWTPNKGYAARFGNVREKTGSFYKIDNGNRVTDVYVEAPTTQPTITPQVITQETIGENIPSESILANVPKAEAKKVVDDKVATILSEMPKQVKDDSRLKKLATIKIIDKGYYVDKLARASKNPELSAKYDNMLMANASANNAIGGYGREGNKSLFETFEPIETSKKTKDFQDYMYHQLNRDRMKLETDALADLVMFEDGNQQLFTKKRKSKMSKNLQEFYGNEITRPYTEIEELSKSKPTGNEEIDFLIPIAQEYVKLKEKVEQIKNKPVFGDTITADISKNKVAEYESKNPEFKEWAKSIYDYNNANLKYLVQTGVITQEQADYLNEKYPHYVPIKRVDVPSKANMIEGLKRASIGTPIKVAKGGSADMLPLKEAMALQTFEMEKAGKRNNFAKELSKTLNTEMGSESIQPDTIIDEDNGEMLTPSTKDSPATLTFYDNGVKKTIAISDEIFESLKTSNVPTIKVFNTISNIRRGLLTEFSPTFMLTNPIKDVQDGLINSKYPKSFPKNIVEAAKQIATKGDLYKEYVRNGGESNSYFDYEKGFTKEKGITDFYPLRKISEINKSIEMAPRLAEYISTIENGGSTEQAMYNAAEITTNFKRGGDWTKFLNKNGATFLNASVQGAYKQVKNVQEARSTALKGIAHLLTRYVLAGVPFALINQALWGDDDDYQDLSDYVKDSYYILWKDKNGTFVKIPKGRVVSILQKAVENIGSTFTGKPEEWDGFLELVTNQLAPNNPIEENIFSPLVQAVSNKAWYGGDLIPRRLQDKAPSEQYDESTDEFSKWIGKKFNISPYKVNYVIDQYSGAIGDLTLPYITKQAENGNDSMVAKLASPILAKFTADSTLKNQNVADFYEISDKLAKAKSKENATTEQLGMNTYFNNRKAAMNSLYKAKRTIQNSDLKDSEKFQQTREIQKQINDIAKSAIVQYNQEMEK